MITTEYLTDKVRVLVNEPADESGIFLLSEETRRLDDTIAALLGDAVSFVQQNKVSGMLNPMAFQPDTSAVVDNGDGTGYIVLPEDFVALAELKMEGWERSCTFMYPPLSSVAEAQSNANTRGGCCKPVCVEGLDAVGNRVACYYSLPADTKPVVKKFVYEAVFDPEKGLATNSANPLLWAVVYRCTGLLYNVFERRDAADVFMTLARSWCGIKENGE